MVDPNWFPSAVMQTVGALYGIFIAFFVLILQRLDKYQIPGMYNNPGKLFDEKIDFFIVLFKVLTLIVVVTELYNATLVYFVSDSIYSRYEYLLLISYYSFAIAVTYVAGFSYYLTLFLSSVVKKSPDFYIPGKTIFRIIDRYDFTSCVALIGWTGIVTVSFIYLKIKQELGGVHLLIFAAFVVLFTYYVFLKDHDSQTKE